MPETNDDMAVKAAGDQSPSPSARIDKLKEIRARLQQMQDAAEIAAKNTEASPPEVAGSVEAAPVVVKPVTATVEDVTKAVLGDKQLRDALETVADAFHKSGMGGLIARGLASLDTEVLNKSLAALGNVGMGIDTKNAPEAVVQAEKAAKEQRDATAGAAVVA